MKKGNRVGKASIEFTSTDGPLAGFHLVGFTICEDEDVENGESVKRLFVLFPASIVKKGEESKPFFFLRPSSDKLLDKLQEDILDVYESMTAFNSPKEIKVGLTE